MALSGADSGFPWPALHFVGVGGHSMSALASALARLGLQVSGSDVTASERTARAERAGVRVFIGHDAANLAQLPPGAVVVRSTDVPADNAELVAAAARGLLVLHRSEVLDRFLRRPGALAIGVTGTHGKSTTTALVGLALLAGGADPTVFVGADVPFLEEGNHRLGSGRAVVAELDESDGSFLRYQPEIAVVTNAEPEHLEHYGGEFSAVLAAYRRFLSGPGRDGLAVLCADAPDLAALGQGLPHTVWYGLGPGADLTARDVELTRTGSRFTATLGGRELGSFRLGLKGLHNVQNALAAIAVAQHLDLDLGRVGQALDGFTGATRRFQVLAERGGVTVVDDYAHHPSEIRQTLAAARTSRPGRVLAIFQPHRYQRTRQLWDAFGPAFADCDLLLLTEIYAPAGEPALPGVDARSLGERIARESGREVRFIPDPRCLVEECLHLVRPGDLVLVMGAGSITEVAHALAARLAG